MSVRLTLRTRLTVAYTTIFLLLMVLFGVMVYGSIRLQLEDAADDELTSKSDAVIHLLQTSNEQQQPTVMFHELREHLDPNGKTEVVQIKDLQGVILFRSGNEVEVTSPAKSVATFSDVRAGEKTFRLFRRQFNRPQPYVLEIAIDRSAYQEALETVRTSLYLGVPVGLLLSFLAGYWMSGRVLRPIKVITETVRDIDDRRLAVRLPLRESQDELEDLSQTLNGMLDRLQGAFHRMGQFTADASHELRTPLALIRGNAEIMRSQSKLPVIADARAVEILAEVDRMQMLIEDLLELARDEEQGKLALELLDPADLTRRASEVGVQLAAQKGIDFITVGPKDIFPVLGNDRALSRVLVILIDNAVRHTPSGQSVRLLVVSSPDQFRVDVQDTGIGIPEKHLPHIFERFYRTDEARNRLAGGAGLGLAIAQAIVTAHNGDISVKSEPGRGSTFRIIVPNAVSGRA